MNTIGFNPNYSNKIANTNHNNKNVNFKGALGDKFVEELASGKHVKTETIMDSLKGTFGPNKSKVADVIDSFTHKIMALTSRNSQLEQRVNDQSDKIVSLSWEKRDALDAEAERLENSFHSIMRGKDKEIAQKDARIKELEKYKAMSKVKSIKEIDAVMPDVAIDTLDKMIAKREESTKSMLNFLTTGKGQEEALEQVNRNNIMLKAHNEGVTDIKEVKEATQRANDAGIWISSDSNFTINMIGQALKGWSHGSKLNSTPIKTQIEENAMALLIPMAEEGYCNSGISNIARILDKTIENAKNYHNNFSKGKEKLFEDVKELNKKGQYDITEVKVPFSSTQSKFVLTNKENPAYKWERSFEDIAMMGENR